MTEIKMEPWEYEDMCVVCGDPFHLERHHIFHGFGRRKKSEEYGYVIPLCHKHHTGREGIHFKRDLDLAWMQAAQRHFEEHYGSREDFIKEFGKSWILEDE